MSFLKPGKIPFSSLVLLAILLVFSISAVSGQIITAKKDLMFTQVFAGPSGGTTYTSVISVTNRGDETYNGTLYFRTGNNAIWNPTVNGAWTSGGSKDVLIFPNATKVFSLTSAVFTVGYAYIYSDDFSLDNFIEGNLSYFASNGSTLMDAVGVPESKEFKLSTLPFDMYSDVGLSLVNPSKYTGRVWVKLFEPNGDEAARCDFSLQSGEHYAKYLSELPWDSSPVGFGPVGMVEITSDTFISGIAMLITPGSAAGAQISTLPLGASPTTLLATFTGSGDIEGEVYKGVLTLWVEGIRVTGHLQMTEINEIPVNNDDTIPMIINGQLVSGELELTCVTGVGNVNTWPGIDWYGGVLYLYVTGFDPSGGIFGHWYEDQSNRWVVYHAWDTDQDIVGGNLMLGESLF